MKTCIEKTALVLLRTRAQCALHINSEYLKQMKNHCISRKQDVAYSLMHPASSEYFSINEELG